jgi:hypothetical protein
MEINMEHKIISIGNGMFGIMRVASGCVYGKFNSWVDAVIALAEANNADGSLSEA